ncbi:short-chain dehydrogenase [Pisolithus marmoratus]|nr:short-chain dehydrogenase [Pisolithus marmoratus]
MDEILQLFRLLWDQRRPLPIPTTSDDISSKVFMVVGSNAGLGLEASVFLASQKPKLLVATSRDSTKCKLTREAILERTDSGNSGDGSAVEAWPLEMSSFDSVRAIADRLAAREDSQLNVLVANAGVILDDLNTTADGWELTLQVNYLSTVLLSLLLLPYLVKSSTTDSPSRLVIVSSSSHYSGPKVLKKPGNWDHIMETMKNEKFDTSEMYCVSKLMSVMFVRELEARLPNPTPVIVCAVDPGLCHTKMLLNSPASFLTCFARTAEKGSRTLLHAAIGDEARAMHGRYMKSCRVGEESTFIASPEGKKFSRRLWDETIQLLSQIDSRIPEITGKYLRSI